MKGIEEYKEKKKCRHCGKYNEYKIFRVVMNKKVRKTMADGLRQLAETIE